MYNVYIIDWSLAAALRYTICDIMRYAIVSRIAHQAVADTNGDSCTETIQAREGKHCHIHHARMARKRNRSLREKRIVFFGVFPMFVPSLSW